MTCAHAWPSEMYGNDGCSKVRGSLVDFFGGPLATRIPDSHPERLGTAPPPIRLRAFGARRVKFGGSVGDTGSDSVSATDPRENRLVRCDVLN